MAASVVLTTKAAVKLYLGIPTATTTYDDFIDALIDRASEEIERFCNRKFLLAEYTEYFDAGDCEEYIVLSNPPIWTSIAGTTSAYTQDDIDVRDDPDFDWESEDRIDDDGDLRVEPDTGLVHVFVALSGTRRAVKAVYFGGYGTIPDDLAQACVEVVAERFNRSRNRADGVRTESEAGMSVTWADAPWPPLARATIESYRRQAL